MRIKLRWLGRWDLLEDNEAGNLLALISSSAGEDGGCKKTLGRPALASDHVRTQRRLVASQPPPCTSGPLSAADPSPSHSPGFHAGAVYSVSHDTAILGSHQSRWGVMPRIVAVTKYGAIV